MKKFVPMVLSGALAIALVACGGNSAQNQTQESTPTEATQVVGGWTVETGAVQSTLTEKAQSIFESAIAEQVGVTYTPVAVLGTQVVAGTNYAFLCQGTTATADPQTGWYIVEVYNDLEGKSSVLAINELDPTAIKVAGSSDTGDVMGGWEILEAAGTEAKTDEASKALAAASETFVGVDLKPIAHLASQLVSGNNYLFLCSGTTTSPTSGTELYAVEVYQPLEGDASITNTQLVDLTADRAQ